MAQLVERILGKDEVAGSTPASSSKNPECKRIRDFSFHYFIFHGKMALRIEKGFAPPFAASAL